MQHLFGTLHSHGTWVQLPAKWDRLGGHAGRCFNFFFFVFFDLGRCNNNDESHRAIICKRVCSADTVLKRQCLCLSLLQVCLLVPISPSITSRFHANVTIFEDPIILCAKRFFSAVIPKSSSYLACSPTPCLCIRSISVNGEMLKAKSSRKRALGCTKC